MKGETVIFGVLETTAPFLRERFDVLEADDLVVFAFVRGYFDADGGMPRDSSARLYFQFVQKDPEDLKAVRDALISSGIDCGALHNPSRCVDPNYWRFFISSRSHGGFMKSVGSWHPVKAELIRDRLKHLLERKNPQVPLDTR